jgi:ribosomal protein S2
MLWNHKTNKIPQNLPNQNWKKIVDQLVIENCLAFGDDSKFTQKKVARYLLGTRATFEIFKLYELRYLLLKVYPFIQNLFYNPRLNSTLKIKKLWNKNYKKQLETQRKLGTRLPSNKWKPRVRIINSFVQKEKNLTPQVLFATVTPIYTDIIKAAAQICNMPSHENRWLNGSITAAISYQEDHVRWNYITDEIQAQTVFNSTKTWGLNKENSEKTKEKLKYHGESRWPSLIVIPDLSNNIMILKEAKKIGLPVMGLVNSSTPFQIDYPIFAQEQTIQSVHFFCHFLATLIAKEMVYIQHKRYILQKKKRKLKPKGVLLSKSLQPKDNHLMRSKTWHKPFWRNTVFFRIVKPTNDRKVLDKEWHTEYSTLKLQGPYFRPKFKFSLRKPFVKNIKKKRFTLLSVPSVQQKFVLKKRKENHISSKVSFSIKKSAKNKKYKQKGKKLVGLKLKMKFNVRPKKFFKHLQPGRILKIIGRYLKKKKKVSIIKKQKYLSLILNLQKKVRIRSRLKSNRNFLQQEAFKKRFGLKRKAFLVFYEQRQLWKKIHKFLIINKIISLQKKNKVLHFQKARFHTGYKSYHAITLKQWKQTTRFQSVKHSLAIVLNYISYKERWAEKQYYDAHPVEWKAEKARRYYLRSLDKDFKKPDPNSKKKNWSRWTEENKSQHYIPEGIKPAKSTMKNEHISRKKTKLLKTPKTNPNG